MKVCLLALALVAPAVALSQENPARLRYDYVGASIAVPDLGDLGVGLEGSTTVARNMIVFGRYFNYEPRRRVDIETLQIGVGRVWNFRRNMDFVGSISFSDNEIDTPATPHHDEEGFVVGGQVRGWATRRLELSGAAMLDNSRGSSTDTTLEFGVQYLSDSRLSYGGTIRIDEDDSTVLLGARWYFGASRRPIGQ